MNQFLRLVSISLAVGAAFSHTQAQNVVVSWSAFAAGGGRSATSQLALTSGYGQPLIGKAIVGNTAVQSGFLAARILLGPVTGIPGQPSAGLPAEFGLSQNFPNPFNPSTTIRYQLPVASHITLKVYDVLGREVAVLVDELQEAGSKSVVLNADRLASGTYFYRLQVSPMDGRESGSFVTTRKLLLMR